MLNLGIPLCGAIANFLRKKREGYNILMNPLMPHHTNVIFNELRKCSLHLLKLEGGSIGCTLADGLFSGTYANNFSSETVKNAGKT